VLANDRQPCRFHGQNLLGAQVMDVRVSQLVPAAEPVLVRDLGSLAREP
jgi:hypothetical protein